MSYQYSIGDKLSDRNTYFYTEFEGEPFLHAWEQSRAAARNELRGEPIPPSSHPRTPPPAFQGEVSTSDVLAYLLGELEFLTAEEGAEASEPLSRWLDQLVQRFEVSKRFYRRYSWTARGLRAVRDTGYDDLTLYLGAAEVLERAHGRLGRTQLLNTLLKINDTLVSIRQRLSGPERAQAASLLERERVHVRALADQLGVTW